MIHKSFPPIKAVVATLLPQTKESKEVKKLSAKFNITPAEFLRRDTIVRTMYEKNPWKAGEVLIPKNDQDLKTYGKCTVRSVYKNYSEFSPHDEWPVGDVPYIISVSTEKACGGLICTGAWLKREEVCSC
jgi:hypothetical protein